jgi:DNA polymerase-3 subunit epsilon
VPICLLALQAVLLQLFFSQYLESPLEVAERVKLILNSNPSHRIEPTGGPELRELEQAINDFAARHQALQQDVESKIREAQTNLEQEKNRLVALISELAQSVIVCNVEGRILLYNNRARQLMGSGGEHGGMGGASLVGLGRSVFAILDRSLITHALENLQGRLDKREAGPVASFVAAVGGQLLRVQVAPVLGAPQTLEPLDSPGADPGAADAASRPASSEVNGASTPAPVAVQPITGFVLILEDVTRAVEVGTRKDAFLQSLIEATRRASANIRAAVETLVCYPDIEPPQEARFLEVIRDEASRLSARLERVTGEYAASLKNEWLLEDMLGADLLSAATKRIEKLGIRVDVEAPEASLWLKVDSHALVRAASWIARRLRNEFGVRELRLALHASGRLAQLDLAWSGAAVTSDALASWEQQTLEGEGEQFSMTLRDVLEHHDGDILHHVDAASGTGLLRLLLPVAQPEHRPAFRAPPVAGPRPEYYDFDLFHQAGQTPELDERKLSELTYTVFDTETTGLDPSQGDEIVSIGALRIVNGRLLRDDAFDQLVDPRRPVSLESIKITGIDPAMLKGQPTIDRVLPQFHRFCEETVLVAHNAAFDMRFLQLKEKRTGVRFGQPVLDTLLLAAVIQPKINDNALDSLAERFGVQVIGRHTALGDAIMTGEIFLKMLPLLADLGITTLGQAREASQKTFAARVKY